MNTERRGVLDQIVLSMRAGRLSRRTFLERALSIGLTAGSATALLEACGTVSVNVHCTPANSSSSPNVIVWQSEYDAQGIFGANPCATTGYTIKGFGKTALLTLTLTNG